MSLKPKQWDNLRLIRFYRDELCWCQCGMPGAAVELMRDALRLRKQWSDENRDMSARTVIRATIENLEGQQNTWSDRCKAQTEKERALLPTNGIEYFVWYVLDAHNLLEHGSSLPGWLTSKGEALLDALERYGVSPDEWGDDSDWAFREWDPDGKETPLNPERPEEHEC